MFFKKKSSSFSAKKIAELFRKRQIRPPRAERIKSIAMKALLGMVVLGILGTLGLMIILASLEIPRLEGDAFRGVESTIIYDRAGNPLYTIHGEENRKEIPLSEIPKHVIDATLAIEDDQFYEHFGFDVGGIVKGALYEFFGIGARRGGSTITQQLVKNTLLTSERTITRKLKELVLAIQVERTYGKNEILERYLNTIPYGSNAYGVEMAAKTFFGKSAKDLSLLEAGILASLPQAPSRYNPYGNNRNLLMGSFDDEGDYIPGRKDLVLQRMETLGYISREEHQKALGESSTVEFKRMVGDITYPHFVLYVKELLENKFGKEAVETGGLRVYTTIDPTLQDKAEEVVTRWMETFPETYGATNTGLFSVDLEKGHILAMVGSADYWNEDIDGNVNMVFRNRLAGSAFKPVVYAAGFLKGYSPATILFDLETDFGNDYIPQNYDGTFYGPTSVRKALAHSRNIPAVKMAFLAGVDNVVNLGKSMGFTDLIDADQYGTSIGLGTAEVTLYQMVTAYSTFARGGNKIAFTPFLRIETSDGKIIENNENRVPREQRVLDPQIAYTVNHILSDPAARPSTWTRLQIPNQINAVKTGTSNKRVKTPGIPEGVIKPMDNWIIGYTTRIASGVWVGNNDATPLKPISDGLTTAGRIWHDFMAEATKENDLEEFPKPKGITWKKVSRWSGLLPSPHTPPKDTIVELFTTFNTPEEVDQTFLSVEIDEVSRKLPTEFTPVESIVKALVANFRSENPTDPNWERPVQAWARNFIDTTAKDYVILAAIPTEYDNIHTQSSSQQKSSIHITSPTDGGEIMAGGTIDVQVRIDAPHGTKKVEYSLSGRLADTAIVPPFTGKLRIRTHKIGQLFSIEAKLTDQYGYQTSDSIEVVTAELTDTENPVVQITYPQEGAIFPANTTITVRAEARDNVSVAELLFFLDDREIERISTSPFHLSLTLPDEIAPHAIRVFAKDTSGNTASDEVAITIEEPDESGDIPTQFIFPKEAASFTVGSPIDLFFQISPEELKDAMEITVKAKELASGRMDIIFRVKDAKITQHYSSTWWPGIAGDYELSIQTIGASGIPRESEKLNLKLK